MRSISQTSRFIRYGALGFPLAFVGLPIYVHIPQFYAVALHIDLGALGGLLLAVRMLDTFSDPFIGVLSDRFSAHRIRIMAGCVPILSASYALLFMPPQWAAAHPLFWLGACLAIVYLAFSTLMINYYAMGVDMGKSYDENTRISAWREGSLLAGVLLASLLPSALMHWLGMRQAYGWFSLTLTPLLFACAFVTLSAAPSPPPLEPRKISPSFAALVKSPQVRWILLIALFNAIPNAITSTLFLFYTGDVLRAGLQSGIMLAVYFLFAAFAVPLWVSLSDRLTKRRSLLVAMVMAIACFIGAWRLGQGDFTAFYVICALSGMAMGADVALLPSLFADVLADKRESSATGFGLWNLTSKLTLALAAGISLPLLGYWGYHPGAGNTDSALRHVALCYGLLPCLFKAMAALLLYICPLDSRRTRR